MSDERDRARLSHGYHGTMAKTPLNRETVKKLLDTLTPMSPESAEKFVQDLLRVAEERRKDLERVVGDVAKVGVRTAEGIATSVQHELGRQVTRMAARIDDLERQVEGLNKALESTRSSLLALAARSMAKGSETDSSSSDSSSKKAGKSSKKADKKADKKARRSKEASAGTDSSAVESGSADGSAAVAGI